jgi:hypothetical protein
MFRREGEYMEVNASAVLPPLTAAQVGVFLELGLAARRPEWLNQVRAWVQEHL